MKDNIFKISNDYKLDRFKIFDEFNYATKNFNWYNFGLKLFDDKKSLKRLYFGCWYSPDAMGLIAAAKKKIFRLLTCSMDFKGNTKECIQTL